MNNSSAPDSMNCYCDIQSRNTLILLLKQWKYNLGGSLARCVPRTMPYHLLAELWGHKTAVQKKKKNPDCDQNFNLHNR